MHEPDACPHCGDNTQLEPTPEGWFCTTCGRAWVIMAAGFAYSCHRCGCEWRAVAQTAACPNCHEPALPRAV